MAIYKQDKLETNLNQDRPLSSIISSEIKLCTLNLSMFISTFIDKSQNGPALRYFSSHVYKSKCKSLILIRGTETELAYTLSKIIIAKNSFPDRVSVLLLI